MNKKTFNWIIILVVCGFVALPDLFPLLGDLIDASVVAWALAYFNSQAAERFPNDERFSDPRMSRRDYTNSEIVDVEWRRAQ